MAYVKFVLLSLFLLATFVMFPIKIVEACSGSCWGRVLAGVNAPPVLVVVLALRRS
ncbi:hypothetical protein A2U01_0057756, partial [Trifolium medium]|nr:hypothetical protein [Trifolium medium]